MLIVVKNGLSALMCAAKSGSADAVKALLAAGADVTVVDKVSVLCMWCKLNDVDGCVVWRQYIDECCQE